MIRLTGRTDIRINEPVVVTIGKFDGEHRGHKKLLSAMAEKAKELGLKSAIFTFETPPSAVIKADSSESGQISTNEERSDRLQREGIDYLIEYPFTEEISRMDGESFIRDILIGKMNMKAIVAGPDCAFGYKKSGNAALLRKLSEELSYEVEIIEKETDDESREISSTLIRSLLDTGDIENANALLGYRYSVSGTVVSGNRIGGSRLDMPTANIYPSPEKHLPRFGVYATEVILKENGRKYPGLTNVGVNPSIKNDIKYHTARIETFIYGLNENLYDKEIEIVFEKFMRPEMRFKTLNELKAQMQKDKEAVEAYNSKLRSDLRVEDKNNISDK